MGRRPRTCSVLLVWLLLSSCTQVDNPSAEVTSTTTEPAAPTTTSPPRADVVGLSWAPNPDEVDGLSRLAYTQGSELIVHTADGDRSFLAGVNLGATVPNHAPGELALSADDYRRWFPQMVELGFRAVRIYTIHPPAFYRELLAYNESHPESPLYLVHGVWIPEEEFLTTRDLFHDSVREDFKAEISDAVAVVHGEAELPDRPGRASGIYDADVGPWLVSWLIGVEWDPEATFESDRLNQSRPGYRGDYFTSSEKASPTERWLAEMLDHLAVEQAARGRTMPVAFANWPTTDPLTHPSEPLEKEDLVGVDANQVAPTNRWPGGYYASYHAYPYYPDFQRYEEGIADFKDAGGRIDPYAGYLDALIRHHEGLPVLITEFGVPSGPGAAHRGPLGRDQGGHSEQEAMAINTDLLEIIHRSGAGGGFYFEWADEWFKFTWNTIDFEIPPGRRQLWMNAWTNEAHFGLVAVEPEETAPVVIDGNDVEWTDNRSQVILESPGGVREVRARKDAGYLYLRLVLDPDDGMLETAMTLGIDVIEGDGGGLPDTAGLMPEADYAVTLGPGDHGQVWVRASNDPYTLLYGLARSYFDVDETEVAEGSSAWNPHRLILNRPYRVPTTGEERPVEYQDTGILVRGSSDPANPAFDSTAMWEAAGSVVEVRLPWQAIGFSDPSSRQAFAVDGSSIRTETVDRVGIGVILEGVLYATSGYTWEQWQGTTWHERLKVGAGDFGDVVSLLNGLD